MCKRLCSAFFAALSTYSTLPTPKIEWEEKIFPLLLPFLPIVGLIIGGIWYGLCVLLFSLQIPQFILAAMFFLIPLFITGFFHLDGYMDVADAVMSQRNKTERVRILKDSHVGSFAVIAVVIYFLVSYASSIDIVSSVETNPLLSMIIIHPAFLRALCALYILNFPLLSKDGYAALYRSEGRKAQTIWALSLLLLLVIASIAMCGISSLIVLAVALVSSLIICSISCKSLGGINGDVSGASLVFGDMCALIAIAVGGA